MDRLAISYRAEGVKIGGPGGQHEEIDVIAIIEKNSLIVE